MISKNCGIVIIIYYTLQQNKKIPRYNPVCINHNWIQQGIKPFALNQQCIELNNKLSQSMWFV